MDGKIPPAKQGVRVTTKLVKSSTKRMIMTIHESDRSVTIYVGNATIYCIDVQILKKVNGEFYDVGNLSKIRWDKVCSLADDFQKGTDSIMLLKLVISYIHSNYPVVTSLRFTDMSTKECDDGSQINLAALKYLTVGKTWYEDNFGASIDEERRDFYNILGKQLLEKKQKTSWEQLKTVIPIDKLFLPEEEVKDLYTKARTWQEFLNPILQRHGKVKTCMVFSPWFDVFVFGYLRISFISLQYSLPIKDHGIEYTVSDFKGGNRSMTRTTHKKN
jgi:hypothetical protein